MVPFGAWLLALAFALGARRARWAHVALVVVIIVMTLAQGCELIAAENVRHGW